MSVKLRTAYHLEFLCLKGGCIGSSESILVKMSQCWESHVTSLFIYLLQDNWQDVYIGSKAQIRYVDQCTRYNIYPHIFTFSKQAFNESLEYCNRS